jgi:hypothetical protein
MKFVILLVGMALVAWLVMTQLDTAKKTGVPGAPEGTPQQLLDQTRQKLDAANAAEQKRAGQAAAPGTSAIQGSPAQAVPVDPP